MSSLGDFGVTATGFKPKAFSQVSADLKSDLQAAFGANINLADESAFGQIVAIMAERHALLWQLGQSVYNALNPSTATGVSVDNILALSNLQRLPARPSVTSPQPLLQANGVTLYGLLLFGTPGTIVPAGALISDGTANATLFALDAAVTIGASSNAQQSLVFSNAPTAGTFQLEFFDAAGNTLTTPALTYGMPAADPQLSWAAAPTSGTYVLSLAQGATQATQPIAYNATAADLQAAIRALSGYGDAQVLGTAASGFALHFPTSPVPTITASGAAAPTVTASLQGVVNALTLPDGATQPFTDCAVSATPAGYQFDFGAGPLASGQASCGAMPVALLQVTGNSLRQAAASTNVSVLESRVGARAQGVGSATAQAAGPISEAAGALSTIVTPQTGWTGVTNQLDVVAGADLESDAAAIARMQALRNSQGSGSLAAVVERVRQVSGVTAAIGFQNLTNAAQQVLTFGGTPNQGTYQLATTTGVSAALGYAAGAADVQQALAALPGFSQVQVSGTPAYGFVVDFNGSQGGQGQPLLSVLNNVTGVTLSATYGRPPHSIEIVAQGGSDVDVADAIFAATPAGMATYGAPVVQTLGSIALGKTSLALAQAISAVSGLTVQMSGVPVGTYVASIAGSSATMTTAALATISNAPCTLLHAPLVADSAGNSQTVAFSRPTPVPIFVQLQLTTDQYLTPGKSSSGVNAASQFSPASIATIKSNLLALGNAIPIGGRIVAKGTNGLVGSFNSIPGIEDYSLSFGTAAGPTNVDSIQLQSAQAPVFQAANIAVSWV